MVTLVTDGVIPNTDYKKYIIDTASELSQLEATFGNEAYCIGNATTYICNGSGEYVRKKVAGEDALPGVTSEDDGKALVVKDGHWTDVDLSEEYAKNDGYYEEMSVGNAEQLISSVMAEDTAPYTFRTTGGSADVGDRLYEKIVGGTIAWNQLIQNGNFASATNWSRNRCVLTVDNNVGHFVCNSDESSSWGFYQNNNCTVGHKLLALGSFCCHTTNPASSLQFISSGNRIINLKGYTTQSNPQNDVWYDLSFVGIYNETSATVQSVLVYSNRTSISVDSDYVDAKNIMLFDLTQMFGPEIADYIYSLESETTGKGVTFFRKLFPNIYYARNAGELISVNTSAHKMIGFNALNPEILSKTTPTIVRSSMIRVVGGQEYELRWDNASSGYYGYIIEYDSNGTQLRSNYTISGNYKRATLLNNTTFVQIQFYKPGSISVDEVLSEHPCLHLVHSGYRNGEYEEYKERVYPLDSSLELRGIPKLGASNNLYYDGDIYESNGTVNRRFREIILDGSTTGRKIASDNQVITSGSKIYAYIVLDVDGISTNAGGGLISNKFITKVASTEGSIYITTNGRNLVMYNYDQTLDTAAKWNTWLASNNVTVVYEVAEPIFQVAESFTSPQWVDDFGTEEYIDYGVQQGERDVSIPVGHESKYPANLRDKLQHLPDLPNPLNNGNYKIRVDDYQMSLVPDGGGGDTVDVVLSYIEGDPTVYSANMTNGEIIDAIESGATVRLLFEIPDVYSGWYYTATVSVGGIGDIEGTRVSDFFAQLLDPYENTIVLLNTGPGADDNDGWRMSFYPIENGGNQLDVTFEGYTNLVTGDYSWSCNTYNDEIIDSLTAGKIVRAIVSVDNLPGYTMYFTQASNLRGYASFYGTALLELNGSNVLCYFQLYQNNEDSWESIITPLNT